MHIEICAGGWNAGDGPTGKQDVELFFSGALRSRVIELLLCWGNLLSSCPEKSESLGFYRQVDVIYSKGRRKIQLEGLT